MRSRGVLPPSTMIAVPSLQIIYASTSGHTEYVIEKLVASLLKQRPELRIEKHRAEQCSVEHLLQGDILLLASGSWNTGGVEGQLNPHLHALLKEKAVGVDLKGKKVALVALGDARYRYTVGAAAHLEEFVKTHGGEILGDTLKIVNEPYGQEKTVEEWGKKLLSKISTR